MARALVRTGCPAEGKAAPGRQGTATHRSPHGRFGHAPPKWKKSFSDGAFRETPERLVKLARLHRPVSAMTTARPACLRYSDPALAVVLATGLPQAADAAKKQKEARKRGV